MTTTEAARLANVAPSTLKRWADQGLVPVHRTAGGHRRFERAVVERLLREGPGLSRLSPRRESSEASRTDWFRVLLGERRAEVEGELLEARARLGRWCDVADEVAIGLRAIGEAWTQGEIRIADEHLASETLARALLRVIEGLPVRAKGKRAMLACAGADEHTLGLSLAELCLRELGWSVSWLGRRTPLDEMLAWVSSARSDLVVLAASPSCRDPKVLERIERMLGRACRASGVGLVLGGSGPWSDKPTYGSRARSFAQLHDLLVDERVQV